MEHQPDFSAIVQDNESVVAASLADGRYIETYLFIHACMEALLRVFLKVPEEKATFATLIQDYQAFLQSNSYPYPEFIDELTKFNKRRNRIIHQLWRKGYSATNSRAESAAKAGVIMYALFIEWLETFDQEITKAGFTYDA